MTLVVFVALYVLVYIECLVRRWLSAAALLTWACLVTLGYVLVFDSWTNAACAWEQVTPVCPGPDAASRPRPLWAQAPLGTGPACGVWGTAPSHAVAVGLRLRTAPVCFWGAALPEGRGRPGLAAGSQDSGFRVWPPLGR